MAVDYTKVAQLSAIDSLASVASAAINEVKETAADAIKKVDVSGNTVNFYKNKDAVVGTDAADFTFLQKWLSTQQVLSLNRTLASAQEVTVTQQRSRRQTCFGFGG